VFRAGLGKIRKTSKLRRSDKATGRIRQKPTRLRLGCLLPDEEVKSAMSDGATLIRPTTSSCILHPVSCIKKKAPLLTPSPSYPPLSFFLYPLSFIFYPSVCLPLLLTRQPGYKQSYLRIIQLIPKRRHTAISAFTQGGSDGLYITAIQPYIVHQTGRAQ